MLDKFKKDNLKIEDDRLIFFWNNRNARRKQSGSLLWWFSEFLNKVGKDKATLVMHTDPKDPNGQDLIAIMNETGLTNREVLLSQQKVPPENLAYFYNAADTLVNLLIDNNYEDDEIQDTFKDKDITTALNTLLYVDALVILINAPAPSVS